MTIDRRSLLGEQLDVDEPYDLGQMDEPIGRLIAERMERRGCTRDEAVTSLLNFAGQVLQEGIVHIDTAPVYAKHPEVERAVEKRRRNEATAGNEMGVGAALITLVIAGAKKGQPENTVPTGAKTRPGLFGDLERIIAGHQKSMDDLFGGPGRTDGR